MYAMLCNLTYINGKLLNKDLCSEDVRMYPLGLVSTYFFKISEKEFWLTYRFVPDDNLDDARDGFSKLMPTGLELPYLWNFNCV